MSDSDYEYDDEGVGLTSVLLGFTGKEATRGELSVLGNHVGGTPIWLGDKPPPSEMLICKVSGKPMELLAQLSCPLPDKPYDRVIYIFGSPDPSARRKEGSIRAIRGIESNEKVRQRIDEEVKASQPENNIAPKSTGLGDSLFSASSDNPFSTASNPFSQPLDTSAAAQQTSQAKSKKKTKSKKMDMRYVAGKYVCKLIEVEEEFIEHTDLNKQLEGVKIEEMETEFDVEGGGSGGDASSSKELATAANEIEARSDPAFTHFVEIVESNPEQVLRYERGLKPLLYSATDGVPEKLKNLKDKILEIQLMPHLISELETEDMILDGMEWGTIFVATDIDDKLPELDEDGIGYVEEWVAVQWE